MNIQTQNINQGQHAYSSLFLENGPARQGAVINPSVQPFQAPNQQQIPKPAQQSDQQHFINQQQRVGFQQGNQSQYAQQLMQAPQQQRNLFSQPAQINLDLFKNNNQVLFDSRSSGQEQNSNRNNRVNNHPFIPPIRYEHISKMLELILQFNLHLDSEYTSIYGIWHTVQYLQDAQNRFTAAYYQLLQFILYNDKLIRWYEMMTKEFHLKFGIPTVLDSNWVSFTQHISVLSINCTLTLNHSDAPTNFTLLMNKYYSLFNQYRETIKDQEEQQILKNVLQHLSSNQTVDIYSIFQLSALGGLNIMVHQNVIPAQHPILIKNGKEVSEDKFPKYNVIQLFTLDSKLYYEISLNNQDKYLLDQYIHYDVNIQHIDYSQEADQVLVNMKLKEEKVYQQRLLSSQFDRIYHLKEICRKRPAKQCEQKLVQGYGQKDNQVQHPLKEQQEDEVKAQQEESKEQSEFYELDEVFDEQVVQIQNQQ